MTDNDVKLLKFVNESGYAAHIEDYQLFDIGAEPRLQKLLELNYIQIHDKNIDNSYIGDYEITGKGYAFLSDYELETRKSRTLTFLTLLSNILIPLIVSILSNLIISLIKI